MNTDNITPHLVQRDDEKDSQVVRNSVLHWDQTAFVSCRLLWRILETLLRFRPQVLLWISRDGDGGS